MNMIQAKKMNAVTTSTGKKNKTDNIPPLQIALDLIDLPRAINIAEKAVKGILSETEDISKAWVEVS